MFLSLEQHKTETDFFSTEIELEREKSMSPNFYVGSWSSPSLFLSLFQPMIKKFVICVCSLLLVNVPRKSCVENKQLMKIII